MHGSAVLKTKRGVTTRPISKRVSSWHSVATEHYVII